MRSLAKAVNEAKIPCEDLDFGGIARFFGPDS
jgi:hypothetical protein